jgi:hypothetical protein
MADEIHLADGTIIDIETGEFLPPERETYDWRVLKAREHLEGSRPPGALTTVELQLEVTELRRLLGLTIEVCDDWAVAFRSEELDRQYEHVILSP